ncbi:hypothetical protein A6J40_13550 [Legionella longbeachae]|nr:hypothetical protein A6J40_13550 [Legionella longbeachae]
MQGILHFRPPAFAEGDGWESAILCNSGRVLTVCGKMKFLARLLHYGPPAFAEGDGWESAILCNSGRVLTVCGRMRLLARNIAF